MRFGPLQKPTYAIKFGKPIHYEDKLIKSIVKELGGKKSDFIRSVQNEIKNHIEAKSPSDCLTLVSRYDDGSKCCHWYPSEVFDGYTGRMIAFLRGQKYEGKTIDSALTDPVVDIVSKKFSEFYNDNSLTIAKPLLIE